MNSIVFRPAGLASTPVSARHLTMPSSAMGLTLFVSSFSPLLVVFALLDTFGKGLPSLICLVLAVASVLALILFLRYGRRLNPSEVTVNTARPRDSDAIAYIVTYLVPFASLVATTPRQRLAIGIFLAVLAVLYLRARLFYVNPVLAIGGIVAYDVVTKTQAPIVVMTHRKHIGANEVLQVHRLSDYVYLEQRT